jgi:hypothetical protein
MQRTFVASRSSAESSASVEGVATAAGENERFRP